MCAGGSLGIHWIGTMLDDFIYFPAFRDGLHSGLNLAEVGNAQWMRVGVHVCGGTLSPPPTPIDPPPQPPRGEPRHHLNIKYHL